MAGNSFGTLFRITTFGESHGEMIGVIIDGCPAGLEVDLTVLQFEVDRRKPGQSRITTARNESDTVRILSGIFEGKTLGTPIAAIIVNEDQRPTDYEHLAGSFRPSHADFTYEAKFGHRDPRGGGRASARETAVRVVAGAIAKVFLRAHGIEILGFVSTVGHLSVPRGRFEELDLSKTEQSIVRCPDPQLAAKMITLIEEVKSQGDTIGGVVSCIVRGAPAGLGEPVFDRLHAELGRAMLSINAAKGFEYGSGFAGVELRGSVHNDAFVGDNGKVRTKTNYSGGIQGGISNGMDIVFRVAFKPVATLMTPQETVDDRGDPKTIEGRGRHDPCVVPRAVPIVEAMAALVMADHVLRNRASKVRP